MYNYSNIDDRANNLEQSGKKDQWSDKITHPKSLNVKKSEDSTDSKKIERKILLYHCCNTTTLPH